jgi:hypothetical protein
MRMLLAAACYLATAACAADDRLETKDLSPELSAWTRIAPTDRFEIESPLWVRRDSLLGEPQRLLATRQYLWVVDRGDPFLHALDLETGEVQSSRIRRGSGPGELSGIPTIGAWDSAGRIWLADLQARRLIVVESGLGDSTETLAIVPSEGNRRAVRFAGDSTSLWGVTVGPDGITPRRLTVADDSGARTVRLVERVSAFPAASLNLTRRQRRDLLLQGSLCVAPSGGAAAYAPFGEGMLFLTSGGDDEWRLIDGPVPSRPEVSSDTAARYAPTRHYYIDCTWSRSQLFLLFSGGRIGPADNDPSVVGREVHVLARSGELTQVIRLPAAVTRIAVDEAGATLFAISGEKDAVIAYRIGRSEARRER